MLVSPAPLVEGKLHSKAPNRSVGRSGTPNPGFLSHSVGRWGEGDSKSQRLRGPRSVERKLSRTPAGPFRHAHVRIWRGSRRSHDARPPPRATPVAPALPRHSGKQRQTRRGSGGTGRGIPEVDRGGLHLGGRGAVGGAVHHRRDQRGDVSGSGSGPRGEGCCLLPRPGRAVHFASGCVCGGSRHLGALESVLSVHIDLVRR